MVKNVKFSLKQIEVTKDPDCLRMKFTDLSKNL